MCAGSYAPSTWLGSVLMEKHVPMLIRAGLIISLGLPCAPKRRKKNWSRNGLSSAKNKSERRSGNENGEMNVVGVADLAVVASAGVEEAKPMLDPLSVFCFSFYGDCMAWSEVWLGQWGFGFSHLQLFR
jgi:hypothetical protein